MGKLTWLRQLDGSNKLYILPLGSTRWIPYDAVPELAALGSDEHPEIAEMLGEIQYSDGWHAFRYLMGQRWKVVPASQAKTIGSRLANLIDRLRMSA